MRQLEIGRSGIRVPDWGLGTMTFGNQTPEEDAHRQLDMALEAGIALIDTAEMYPVNPVRAETAGRSEEILGRWLSRRGEARARVVVATKIAGPGNVLRGETGFDPAALRQACEASLRRLRTDRIDLWQLHWPERDHYHFRRNWTYAPPTDRGAVLARMDEVLGTLARLAEEGKIRAFGLSNETAWGTLRWLDRAAATGGPRMEAVQNEYSLLCRLWDTDMAEAAAMEQVTLLAFSPLAAGLLTGKYADGARPEGSRLAVGDGRLGGRYTARALAAEAAYRALAAEAGMDPVHMALAWHRTRPFDSIPLLGATTAGQLAHALKGLDVAVPPDLAARIDALHREHPMPF
ncbi:putative oxidoreductase [Rubellimicrobium thermophilum DSM 16684]|uniref:Putative oxidoreductase n=1 Tax=Rubellimicrobium thermophilum DSM 16684 TaxID=1123069 RepID=S9QUP1_9RHOB|nr:aldo/keto reductase [Rubellimicrobium thermophilum]EPX85081.1 putative oxidoreductase [Rubellimicrobium thermophilum DSM 16684]